MTRAWLWLGLVEAALVLGGFFLVLHWAGWSPGDDVGSGSPLHADYLTATAMTFAGITACQVGTAFAARTSRASLREIGFFSNLLLRGRSSADSSANDDDQWSALSRTNDRCRPSQLRCQNQSRTVLEGSDACRMERGKIDRKALIKRAADIAAKAASVQAMPTRVETA